MMHPGFEKTLTVQSYPKPNRAEFGRRRQLARGKINLCLVRHQLHVVKYKDSSNRLLGDLSAPARFGACIIAFAFFKTEFEQELVQFHEMLSRTTEGVMIVIAPAQAKEVLAMLLNSPGAIAAFPVRALGLEEKLAG